jgi:hypothetical protein
MQVLGIRRVSVKTAVVVGDEPGQPRVRRGNRRYPRKPQLLDQPVLQRTERALDPALCLRAVRTDDVDVQLRQRTAKLCDTLPPIASLLFTRKMLCLSL